jgi:hypothetical protein
MGRALTPEEAEDLKSARDTLRDLQQTSSTMKVLRKTSPVRKRKQNKAAKESMEALQKLPYHRTPSFHYEVQQLGTKLSIIDPSLSIRLELLKQAELCSSLSNAIEAAIAYDSVEHLLEFDPITWERHHCERLLTNQGVMRSSAFKFTKTLLAGLIPRINTEDCLRSDSVATRLLQIWLVYTDDFQIKPCRHTTDPKRARSIIRQCLRHIPEFNKPLIDIIRFTQGLIETPNLMRFLFLRYFVPLFLNCYSLEVGKLLLRYAENLPERGTIPRLYETALNMLN